MIVNTTPDVVLVRVPPKQFGWDVVGHGDDRFGAGCVLVLAFDVLGAAATRKLMLLNLAWWGLGQIISISNEGSSM